MKVRLSFIVAVMCLLVLACSTGEKAVSTGVAWAGLSLDDAKLEAANQNKLIMVDVFSPT
jgi:phosphoribosylaminoimidazole-succinocarboxamide synthase